MGEPLCLQEACRRASRDSHFLNRAGKKEDVVILGINNCEFRTVLLICDNRLIDWGILKYDGQPL